MHFLPHTFVKILLFFLLLHLEPDFSHEFVNIASADALHQLLCILQVFPILFVRVLLAVLPRLIDFKVEVFCDIDDVVGEHEKVVRAIFEILACFSEFEDVLDLIEDVNDHGLDGLVDHIEIISLVKFVSRVKNVVDVFHNVRGVANLIVDDARLLKQQIMINVDIFRSKVCCIAPKIIKFVHVDATQLIADYFKLPRTLQCCPSLILLLHSLHQILNPFYLVCCESATEAFQLHNIAEKTDTCVLYLQPCGHTMIKSATKWSLPHLMQQSCNSDCQYG